jgi:acetyl esterase
MPLDPVCEAMLANAVPADISIADFRALEPAHVEARRPFSQAVAAVKDEAVAGPGGPVPVRIYAPFEPGPRPLLILAHGGGWVVGSIETHDVMARDLCLALGAVVVSVEYRRAPESPFPAAIDDCWAVLTWAAGQAGRLGADVSRLVVAGDSAGGNLAAALAVRARDEGGPRLAAQLLIHPVVDLAEPFHPTASPLYPSRRVNGAGFGATSQQLEAYGRMYLPDPGQAASPLASPLRAPDAPGLAPAVIVIAEYDPLHDEGAAYAAKLEAQGVAVVLRRYEGAIHGAFGPARSAGLPQRAFVETMADLRHLLAPGQPRDFSTRLDI